MTSQMFQCQDKPNVPADDMSDAVLATYMVSLVLAYNDCLAQLGTVRNHLEINGVQITETYKIQDAQQRPNIFSWF